MDTGVYYYKRRKQLGFKRFCFEKMNCWHTSQKKIPKQFNNSLNCNNSLSVVKLSSNANQHFSQRCLTLLSLGKTYFDLPKNVRS